MGLGYAVNFYLGAHRPAWLATAGVPLFVSQRTLGERRSLPRAAAPWALDSGGFSELSMFGEWRTTPEEYVAAVRRYRDEIGALDWVAPQDWMCEPWILEKTGKDVLAHQWLTIRSVERLRAELGSLVVPVLQGWSLRDYLVHMDEYARVGIDLTKETLVGVGSVCRRQATGEIDVIMETLAGLGLKLHGFGVKVKGLRRYAQYLASADSLAWSFAARMEAPLPGHAHKACNNCMVYAMKWRDRVLDSLTRQQLRLVPA